MKFYLFKLPRDTWACLISALLILFLGLSLHWANHYPFDWIKIIWTSFFIFLAALAYIAGSLGHYPKACSLGRTIGLSFLIIVCSLVALHVLPLSPFAMIDKKLAWTDQALGFNVADFSMEIRKSHPDLSYFFFQIYNTLVPLSFFSMLILPWISESKAREFVLLTSISSFLGLFIYFFLPAIGPMASYHYALNSSELALFKHVNLLRKDGAASQLFLTGDISFPSFHTIIALLATWVWRDYKIIFIPLSLLSVLIIFSTLSTGWHYLSDVLGGILISLVSIFLAYFFKPDWF